MINPFAQIPLALLPPPSVVETPVFRELRDTMLLQFQSLLPEYRLLLESDPVVKVVEAFAYRELILRSRINEVARQNLLAFAGGSNLDHLGAFLNVARLVVQEEDLNADPPKEQIMEDDERYRFRIQLRAMAWGNAGGRDHYRYWAMSASPQVKDVAVYSPDHPNGYNMGGQVNIAVLSTEGNNIPTFELMDTVRGVVMRDDVRVLTDILSVEPAVNREVSFVAKVYLKPTTPYVVFQKIGDHYDSEFDKQQGLGVDITRSWVLRTLHVDGVNSVQITSGLAEDETIAPNEFPTRGTHEIVFGGFSDSENALINEMELRRTTRKIYEYYIEFARVKQRTQAEIMADLVEKSVEGVMQPTVRGLSDFLNIENRFDYKGHYLPEDELCFLCHRKLVSDYYNRPPSAIY